MWVSARPARARVMRSARSDSVAVRFLGLVGGAWFPLEQRVHALFDLLLIEKFLAHRRGRAVTATRRMLSS